VDELRRLELEYAWRLGILDSRNSPESIPEGISFRHQIDGDTPQRSGKKLLPRTSLRLCAREEEGSELWDAYQKAQRAEWATVKANLLSWEPRKSRIRFKLLIVLQELVELSREFYQAEKATISYQFLGFESRITLHLAHILRYSSYVPINKVRLIYFFSDGVGPVNALLHQNDVLASTELDIESQS
jgi:hypothetical protein